MGGIDKILEMIGNDARAEASEIAERSRAQCSELQSMYEKDAQTAIKEIIENAMKKAEEIRRGNISRAEVKCRNIILAAKRSLLDEVFDMAEKRLAELDEAYRRNLYQSLISRYSKEKEITLVLNDEDASSFGGKLKVKGRKLNIDKNAGCFSGGLIIRESKTEIDCTFSSLVNGARRQMEVEISDMIFS